MNLTLRHSHTPSLSLLLFPLEHSWPRSIPSMSTGLDEPRVAVNIRSRSRDRGGRTSREEESLRKQKKKKKKKKRPRREILSCNLVPRFSPRSLSLSVCLSLSVGLRRSFNETMPAFHATTKGTAMTHNVSLVRPRELYSQPEMQRLLHPLNPLQPVRDCTFYFCSVSRLDQIVFLYPCCG